MVWLKAASPFCRKRHFWIKCRQPEAFCLKNDWDCRILIGPIFSFLFKQHPVYIYIYTYIYTVELKICPRFALFGVENLSKVALKICPRFVLLVFPQFYSVCWWSKKTQLVCRGAKIIFLQFVRVSKKVFFFFIKKCALFVFVFYVGKSKKDNMKHGTWKFQKKKNQKNSVFGWLWRKMFFFFFVKMSFFRKIGKHYLCSDGKKRAFSLQLSVFGKWSLFCGHSKWQNTIK